MIDTVAPASLIAPLKQALGVDVSDVRVRRGEETTATARALGARGFTADEVVHVPDSAGPLDGREAAPLLAHELTHAAQQRHFGAALPGLETVTGRRLEAEAVAVEQWVADGANGSAPTVRGHRGPVQLASEDDQELEDDESDEEPVEGKPKRKKPEAEGEYGPLDWGAITKPDSVVRADAGFRRLTGLRLPTLWRRGPERQDENVLAQFRHRTGTDLELPDSWKKTQATEPDEIIAEQLKTAGKDNLELPASWRVKADDSAAGVLAMAAHVAREKEKADALSKKDDGPPVAGGGPRPPGGKAPGSPGGTAGASLDDVIGELADNPPRRWLDLDDPDHFEEISNRVYTTLYTRLRFEMLVDRERSGNLMDFG